MLLAHGERLLHHLVVLRQRHQLVHPPLDVLATHQFLQFPSRIGNRTQYLHLYAQVQVLLYLARGECDVFVLVVNLILVRLIPCYSVVHVVVVILLVHLLEVVVNEPFQEGIEITVRILVFRRVVVLQFLVLLIVLIAHRHIQVVERIRGILHQHLAVRHTVLVELHPAAFQVRHLVKHLDLGKLLIEGRQSGLFYRLSREYHAKQAHIVPAILQTRLYDVEHRLHTRLRPRFRLPATSIQQHHHQVVV